MIVTSAEANPLGEPQVNQHFISSSCPLFQPPPLPLSGLRSPDTLHSSSHHTPCCPRSPDTRKPSCTRSDLVLISSPLTMCGIRLATLRQLYATASGNVWEEAPDMKYFEFLLASPKQVTLTLKVRSPRINF